jgi:MraZ protein
VGLRLRGKASFYSDSTGIFVGFQGESALAFDDKGRVTIPKDVRETLAAECAGLLTIVRNPDGCLMVYPRPIWELKKQEIMNWPMSARHWSRALLGSALNVDIDTAGRIAIPMHYRDYVAMGKKVLLRGAGRYYELWDAEAYKAYEQQSTSAGWPSDLGSMTF